MHPLKKVSKFSARFCTFARLPCSIGDGDVGVKSPKIRGGGGGESSPHLSSFYRNNLKHLHSGAQKSIFLRGNFRGEFPCPFCSIRLDTRIPVSNCFPANLVCKKTKCMKSCQHVQTTLLCKTSRQACPSCISSISKLNPEGQPGDSLFLNFPDCVPDLFRSFLLRSL